MTDPSQEDQPRHLHPRPVDPRQRVAAMAGPVPERGYAVSAPGWPGDGDTVEAPAGESGCAQRHWHRRDRRPLRGTDRLCPRQTRGKPIVVGHSFGGLIAQELLAGGLVAAAVAIDPRHQGREGAAPRTAAVGVPGTRQPSESASHGVVERQAVPLRLRQHPHEEESDALHDAWTIPGAGLPSSRRRGELLPALPGQGRHPPRGSRTAAPDVGHRGPAVPLKVTKEVFDMYAEGPGGHRVPRLRGTGHS